MDTETPADGATKLKVYTTPDGRAVIEQSRTAVVVLSSEQILTVIRELHACDDYCAAWKDPPARREP